MTFIIATQNRKKCAELERILTPLGIDVLTPAAAGITLDDVEETGSTFLENAKLKAVAAMKRSGLPAIADDSGLVVDALGGAPGVYSARYAGENASDGDRIKKLLFEMKDVPAGARQAHFVCALCCVFPDGEDVTVQERCEGVIAFAPQGAGGFGYDPVFLMGGGSSFAQLSDEQKDAVSHRGRALRALERNLKHRIKKDK